ncbi:MAG: M28 family peptidase, partial [Candidatus Omnitrophica bacterium]|nr:M28 family peptidase [Candidatus Omnitrophota bacterium]
MKIFFKWFFISLMMIAATVAIAVWVGQPEEVTIRTESIDSAVDLDFDRVRNHIETFSSFGSRVAGQPGSASAAGYVERQLASIGYDDIESTTFEVAIPKVHQADLRVQSGSETQSFRLFPLWPNLARTSQTPVEGMTGHLVYLGEARFEEMEGRPIEDSICFLDWDAEEEWTRIPELGGRAVVFLGDTPSTGWEARKKFLTIPADVPRFYLTDENSKTIREILNQQRLAGTIQCQMDWDQAIEKNFLVRIPSATGEMENPIVFQAYTDSMSLVPEISPGAEPAVSVSVLLEFARFLKKSDGALSRPVHILFTGGHGTGMAGIIDYIESVKEGEKKHRPALVVSLDLASHTTRFGVHCFGEMRGYAVHLLRPRFSRLALELKSFSERVAGTTAEQSFVDAVNLKHGRAWDSFLPYRAPFASEIANVAGIPGIAIASLDDSRKWVDTPDDTIARLDFDRLVNQLSFKEGEHIGLLRILHALIEWEGPYTSGDIDDKWVNLTGRVQWLKADEDYTPQHPLRDAPVFLKSRRENKYLVGVRGMPVALTDEDGRFSFKGMIDVTGNNWYTDCEVEAYGLATDRFLSVNPEAVAEYERVVAIKTGETPNIPRDGSILYAVDRSQEKDRPSQITLRSPNESLNLEVFPCESATLFGVADPTTLIHLRELKLYETRTDGPPYQFGFSFPDTRFNLWEEEAFSFWAPPRSTLRVTAGIGLKTPRFLLLDNDTENLRGEGVDLHNREVISLASLTAARDVEHLNEARLEEMQSGGIESKKAERFQANAEKEVARAESALSSNRYGEFKAQLERGWGYAGKVYREIFSQISSLMTGILFYLFLIAPSAYFLERILFAHRKIGHRVLSIASIFLVGFLLLWVVHPAFRLTQSPAVVLIAFVLIALSTLVTAVVLNRFDRSMRRQFQSSLFDSSIEGARTAGFARSFEFGIQNIRNRPYRSAMTGLTVVLVTFALLSFLSVSPDQSTTRIVHPKGEPVYKGFLARNKDWGPLTYALQESLETAYGDKNLAGRLWFFSDGGGDFSQIDLFAKEDLQTTVTALVGMEAEETEATHPERALVAGEWFNTSRDNGVLLSETSARLLGLDKRDLGQMVRVYGEPLPLIGIFDADKMNSLHDLDGESTAPVNFVLQRRLMAQRETFERPDTIEENVHHSWENCAIVPFEFARSLGGSLRSIAVTPEEDPLEEAISWTERTDLTFLASDGKEVRLIS